MGDTEGELETKIDTETRYKVTEMEMHREKQNVPEDGRQRHCGRGTECIELDRQTKHRRHRERAKK